MRPVVLLGARAGMAAPLLLVAVLIALTAGEWSFLRSVGWSAVQRTRVEWPSLLALGPAGWVLIAALLLTGVMGALFAVALHELLRGWARIAAWLIGLMSGAVMLEAFRPDSPKAVGATSWHSAIHNDVYPLIPVCALGGALVLSIALRNERAWRDVARASLWSLLLMLSGVALTFIGSVAQLARVLFFGSMLLWLELLALDTHRKARAGCEGGPDLTRVNRDPRARTPL